MKYEKYAELKKDVETYFAKIIKKQFKKHVEKKFEFHFSPDFKSHNLISELLCNDGFDVFGMNANMDGFQLLLDFGHDYLAIDNFPFTRMAVDFNNDGDYSVFLNEDSFEDDWIARLEDSFECYHTMNEADLVRVLSDMKNIHLALLL